MFNPLLIWIKINAYKLESTKYWQKVLNKVLKLHNIVLNLEQNTVIDTISKKFLQKVLNVVLNVCRSFFYNVIFHVSYFGWNDIKNSILEVENFPALKKIWGTRSLKDFNNFFYVFKK